MGDPVHWSLQIELSASDDALIRVSGRGNMNELCEQLIHRYSAFETVEAQLATAQERVALQAQQLQDFDATQAENAAMREALGNLLRLLTAAISCGPMEQEVFMEAIHAGDRALSGEAGTERSEVKLDLLKYALTEIRQLQERVKEWVDIFQEIAATPHADECIAPPSEACSCAPSLAREALAHLDKPPDA